jgi:hypothetical protein
MLPALICLSRHMSIAVVCGCVFASAMFAQSDWRWIGHSDEKFESYGPSRADGQYSAWVGGLCTDDVFQKNVELTSPGAGWNCANANRAVAVGTIRNKAYQGFGLSDSFIHAYIRAWDSVTTFNPSPTHFPMSNTWNATSERHCNGAMFGWESGPIFVGGAQNP